MHSILIIEDERVIRSALRRLLERNGFQVALASSIPDAEAHHALDTFDLIISDLRLPGLPGTEIIERCKDTPVLIMTSYASVKSAVDAMQQGAADYIAKPFDHDELLHSVRRILDKDRLERQNAALKSDLERDYPVAGIVGNCELMQHAFDLIKKVAPTESTVLVLGESGTGKELVARAVHECSPRRNAPLIAVNCAAIAEDLIESELFGHEKGAFTGAIGSRIGLVEAADGGTLFLDEIGELPLAAQARLLRVLQEGEIRRVGSSRALQINVRLIAATHRDLEQRVRQGLFRQDLYFRLGVMEIHLPALRQRGDDIITLANHMLEKACKRLNHHPMRLSPEALNVIQHYPWPGNVRELENAVERAVILSDGEVVTPEALAIDSAPEQRFEQEQSQTPMEPSLEMSLDDYFRHFVLSNQDQLSETELARRLGISRKSLWERRQRLGLPRASRRKRQY